MAALAITMLVGITQALPARAAEGKETALKASDMSGKIFPDKVFFRGQVAPVQMRNTGGIHFADDMYVLIGLVDNSGYSSDIRQKYQAYFISEVPLEVGGQKLSAGAYGVGFLKDNKFVVMDLGAHGSANARSLFEEWHSERCAVRLCGVPKCSVAADGL